MKVLLSADARNYRVSEARYLQARSPQAARQFTDSLKQIKEHLSRFPRFPRMGKQSDDMPVPGMLRFVMGAYLVDYESDPASSSSSPFAMASNGRPARRSRTTSISKPLDAERPAAGFQAEKATATPFFLK